MAIFGAMGWPWGAIAMWTASLNSCGFGPGGLYYNQPTTHLGAEAFAIDFCKFLPGAPLLPTAGGTPILAVADGLVTGVESVNPSGSSTSGNCVRLEHMTESELFGIFIIWLFTGQRLFMPFSSRVLHLAGPSLIPVSVGMHVKQGSRLGFLNDTGNSVADHLHFTMNDRTMGGGPTSVGMSVRPTPIDGQTLNNADDGRCVFSTNVPIP